MIDLEFSKYHDTRDTVYGPYGCTCTPQRKCPACRGDKTVRTIGYSSGRRAALAAQDALRGPYGTRSFADRRAELRGFMVRWLAEFQQMPLPRDMREHSQSRPRPTWARAPAMVYYAYTTFADWYAECLAYGIGTALDVQHAAVRLATLRDAARRGRRKKEQ